MISTPPRVAVLMGGVGGERQVSLQSGAAVAKALRDANIEHVPCDISPDSLTILDDPSISLFFLALHGEFGEDGQLQGILEERGLPYTGSDSEACALAIDKLASKQVMEQQGVPSPRAIEFTEDLDALALDDLLDPLGERVVIKPSRGGSSVGVHIVTRADNLLGLCRQTLSEQGSCMIEAFVPGRELTVGILEDVALPVIEVRPARPFYDYQAKYIDEETQYLFDTLSEEASHGLQQQALRCFQALGLRHFGRVDFILAPDGIAYCLEANSIPGLTSHSLLPKAAQRAGLTMSDLCRAIVEAASCERTS